MNGLSIICLATLQFFSGRYAFRNDSNAYFKALQYRQDLLPIAHFQKRTYFPVYTRCSENHNNTCAENRKICGLNFDTL